MLNIADIFSSVARNAATSFLYLIFYFTSEGLLYDRSTHRSGVKGFRPGCVEDVAVVDAVEISVWIMFINGFLQEMGGVQVIGVDLPALDHNLSFVKTRRGHY